MLFDNNIWKITLRKTQILSGDGVKNGIFPETYTPNYKHLFRDSATNSRCFCNQSYLVVKREAMNQRKPSFCLEILQRIHAVFAIDRLSADVGKTQPERF